MKHHDMFSSHIVQPCHSKVLAVWCHSIFAHSFSSPCCSSLFVLHTSPTSLLNYLSRLQEIPLPACGSLFLLQWGVCMCTPDCMHENAAALSHRMSPEAGCSGKWPVVLKVTQGWCWLMAGWKWDVQESSDPFNFFFFFLKTWNRVRSALKTMEIGFVYFCMWISWSICWC